MASEIKSLKKKRLTIFNRTRTLYDLANEALVDASKKGQLQTRVENLAEWVTQFEDLHLDIVGLIEDNECDTEQEVINEFDSMQFSIKQICKDLLPAEVSLNDRNKNDSNISVSGRMKTFAKPRLDIPTYCGDRQKLPTFYDMFKTLVDEDPEYSDIAKFQFLVSVLEGEAADVIKNIPIQGRNYKTAYRALVDRYQNDRFFLTDYWLAIVNAFPAKNNSSVELRKLISTFKQNLEALDNYKEIDLWDFTKLNLLLQKIDPFLKTRFEIEYSKDKIPSYQNLISILETNCHALENSALLSKSATSNPVSVSSVASPKKYEVSKKVSHSSPKHNFLTNARESGGSSECLYCKSLGKQSQHLIIRCDKFRGLDAFQRHDFAKSEQLCFNCFAKHRVLECPSTLNCRICSRRHSTLLHFPNSKGVPSTVTSESRQRSSENVPGNNSEHLEICWDAVAVNVCRNSVYSFKTVLFATAQVCVRDCQGNVVTCRALLDSASQTSFTTASFAKRLGLPLVGGSTPIVGINNMTSSVSIGNIVLCVSPTNNLSWSVEVKAVVVPLICGVTPSSEISNKWKYLSGVTLADPHYGTPRDEELLLGADVFSQVLLPGFKPGQNGRPCAMNTIFGYVLMGSACDRPSKSQLSLCTSLNSTSLEDSLQRFWQHEKLSVDIPLTKDDQRCEGIFSSTHTRDKNGRYIVRLPFRDQATLGESKSQALKRFHLLEARLLKNPSFREAYCDFMANYLDQNHMRVVNSSDSSDSYGKYYIPHHGIWKDSGESKKFRAVFDGSAQTSNKISLNDVLLVGSKLQANIVSILLNFRVKKVVFTTDIRQMYRNILVHSEDVAYQTIFWRFDINQPIGEYVLNTVTYGLSCSPYLAIRTLLQLAGDQGQEYPLAAEILRQSTYIDDGVGSANSVSEALEVQRQLLTLLRLGGFELRKWASNYPELLEHVPESHLQPFSFDDGDSVLKILGLQWNPVTDGFSYSVVPDNKPCTKRNILSQIARIYDPLGFLSPVVFVAKSLIQKLWLQGLNFDDCPSKEIVDQWSTYLSQLPILSTITIPRCMSVDNVVPRFTVTKVQISWEREIFWMVIANKRPTLCP